MKTFWVVVLVLGCIAISGIVVLARKLQQHRALHAPAAPAPKPAVARTNGFKLEHKLAPALKALSEHNHNHNHNGQGKRKRMFNYHKFYTEMVLQGPAPVITDGYTGFNGHELDSSYRNGQNGNGHGNHNGNGSNGNGNGHGASEPSGAVLNAHSELIASQKSLIEEQKRLIHEQARLIEEKSKLISEKNQLLDRQSQLIDNNLL